MPRPLPDALRAPITDLASAKAWLDALIAADMAFHLEDSPDDIIEGATGDLLFAEADWPLIRDRVAACYALDWGPTSDPKMGKWYCPIGYMLHKEPFNEANQFPGYAPGTTECLSTPKFDLVDLDQTEGYVYGAPGRFAVYDKRLTPPKLAATFDTPEEAEAAYPQLRRAQ